MLLTGDFRERVRQRIRSDREFRRGLLGDAFRSFLTGEVRLGWEMLCDLIGAMVP